MEISELKSRLAELKGKKSQIKSDIKQHKTTIKRNTTRLKYHEQAKEIIREVGLKTQQQLQFHISDITSLAMEAVFTNPYKIEIEFVQRRNKTECDIHFCRDDSKVKPLDASGGGTVDIAAFALRIACWSLQLPHTRNTIILDEPMKWIDITLRDKASQMLKEISDKLNIQFIIVTHDQVLSTYSDKTFEVMQRNGISKVNVL